MSGQRTWASVEAIEAEYGAVTRAEDLDDRRYVQTGGKRGSCFMSLRHGDGCWSPWLRQERRWPAAEIREARREVLV